MKRNFRYITKFEAETRSAMQTRAIGTIDGILNASKLLLTASKKLLRYCDKENNPFVEKLTQFIQTLQAHIQMASRVEKLGLKELSLQYGVDSDNIVSLVGQFYFVDYRKQGVTQREFEGLMDDVVAKGDEVESLANLADRSSSARLERRGQSGDRLNTESIRKEVVNSYFENVGIHYEKDEVNVIDDTHATSKVEQTIGGWQSGWNGKSFTVPVGLPCIPATNLPRKGWWLDNTAPKVKAFIKKIIAMWADAPVENNSSSARLEKRMASKPQPRSDKESEREIMLEITNNYNKESGRLKSIIENLARKMNKQNYDKALASKLYAYLVEDGIKSYTKEFGKGSISLSPASRLAIGAELEEYYVDDVEAKANQLAGIDPQQDLIDAESKRLDWKQNSSSARLEKRGWFGGDDEDEEEEKQPMSNNDAREEVRLIIMNTQGIYSAWMSMVDDACKQWLRTHDNEDDAPTFRDVVDDFTEIVRLGINEMNKSIDEDSEDSEFPENNFSMADIKWIFEHSSAQEDLDEKWDWRKE